MPGIRSDTLIALDLETTGTSARADHIIEVGAVKFRGDEQIDTFNALVNPHRKLSGFIVGLTGITQSEVDSAPDWDETKPQLAEFISGVPIIGHNVGFDASFLRSHDVHPDGVYDTMTMAEIALPAGPEYALGRLSKRFGFSHDNPHRALSDALVTRDLFLHLLEIIEGLDRAVLEQVKTIGSYAGTPLAKLVSRILESPGSPGSSSLLTSDSLTGIDPRELSQRLRTGSKGSPPLVAPHIYEERDKDISGAVEEIFARGGSLEKSLPGFESRPEQVEMARAVTRAIQSEEHLAVEAGTGVGKSLAYLAPSVLHVLRTGGRVLISTNTINLQEQLIGKDVEITRAALAESGESTDQMRAAQLKGRANYLCYKRWQNAVLATEPNDAESRILSKILVWLQKTETGDRNELALGRMTPMFTRYSAQGAAMCPSNEGPCFLRKARNQATNSNVVIINHALLMSDIAMGGGLLPDHDVLVIDEAHHLESAATSYLGFSVNQFQLENDLRQLIGNRGILARLARAITEGEVNVLDASANLALQAAEAVEMAIQNASVMFDLAAEIATLAPKGAQQGAELRLTSAVRTQPIWSDLEIAWENANTRLLEVSEHLGTLCEQASALNDSSSEGLVLDAYAVKDSVEGAVSSLREAIPEPDDDSVYWLRAQSGNRGTNINGAPLDVSGKLNEALFSSDRTVILTGATVAYEKSFERYRASIGLEGGSDLVLGSPFDYEKNVLIAVPEDIPEPGAQGFANATADTLVDIARASAGRVLALFTSISALDNARKAITPVLGQKGIRVIAQGADGSPARIMRMLAEGDRTIALGTSSLWEGVDLQGASLDALVMARLPFPVPTDPVVAARSEQFEDGFREYSIPEAVQRFRQGFGRLIRSRTDRGAFVILDSRIITKNYGVKFQRALPKCTVRRVSTDRLFEMLESWRNGTFE
ncbi:MAG: helicase C-terminal domain-containing protein [Dehalococcoidia bacterium]|nr:helicase C-terminal domain-containing protein [Dehalococcoidia bacterium]